MALRGLRVFLNNSCQNTKDVTFLSNIPQCWPGRDDAKKSDHGMVEKRFTRRHNTPVWEWWWEGSESEAVIGSGNTLAGWRKGVREVELSVKWKPLRRKPSDNTVVVPAAGRRAKNPLFYILRFVSFLLCCSVSLYYSPGAVCVNIRVKTRTVDKARGEGWLDGWLVGRSLALLALVPESNRYARGWLRW